MHIRNSKFTIFLFILIITVNITACNTYKTASVPVSQGQPSTSEPTSTGTAPEAPESTKTEQIPETKPEPVKLVEYNGTIFHVFFHSLIAFPEINYSPIRQGSFDADCITPTEFKRTLSELYKNNYILIDINSTFETIEENGQQVVKDKKLMLPEGKKPLVMSIDDMVYDPKKMGLGMVDKIILDKDGNFATFTKQKDGKEIISYDNEIIPILEGFVNEHPDFSLNNAKATLALTGWVGILGYRIDRLAPNRQNEIDAVKPIVKKLKERGWSFASHSYGHRHSNKISYRLFKDDTKKWHNEIEPVVGPTSVYVYPYGEKLSVNDPKYKLLLEYGFKLICGVGSSNTWTNYKNSIFMERHSIDGYSLKHNRRYLLPLIDTENVLSSEERTMKQ